MQHWQKRQKQRRQHITFGLAIGVICLMNTADAGLFSKRKPPAIIYNDVESVASHFVRLVPNQPVSYPDNLNLFNIERNRRQLGTVILSPDKRRMATTEVLFQPESFETHSRVLISPIGPPPTMQDYLKPDALASVNRHNTILDLRRQPHVTLYDINPAPFYKQFQIEQQQPRSILETDRQNSKPYDFKVFQLLDWSPDGESLLLSYREGVYHSGIQKTIPVLLNTRSGDVTYYRYLPSMIWSHYCSRVKQCSEDERAKTLYDIRLLGWHQAAPGELAFELVTFDPKTTVQQTQAIYSYNLAQNLPAYWGSNMGTSVVVGYGWLVQFTDQSNPNEPETYATQIAPPPPAKPIETLKPVQPRNGWLY